MLNRRILILLALCFAVLAPSSLAQPGDSGAFSFLRLEASARGSALSGTVGSNAGGDISSLFFNPATLNAALDGSLAISYLNHISDLNAGFIAFGKDVESIGTVGVGLRYLGYGRIERADEQGFRDGTTFGAGDFALTGGVSRAISDRLRVGVNVHAILSRLDSFSAQALAADAGVVYVAPFYDFVLSATVNNFGLVLGSLGATQDELPVDLRVGLYKRLQHVPLAINIMGYNLHQLGGTENSIATGPLSHLAIGAELLFSEAFQGRVGYNHRRHEELKTGSRLDLAGLSLGFGLQIKRFNVDYGFNSWSEIGGLHQFTVRTKI